MSDDFAGMDLMDLFRTEVEGLTPILNEGLMELERDPTASDRIAELMRAAHSIKGAARIMGLQSAVEVAHAMEDYFVSVQKGDIAPISDHIEHLFGGVDLMEKIAALEPFEIRGWLKNESAAIEELTERIGSLSDSTAPIEVAAADDGSAPAAAVDPKTQPAPPPPETEPVPESPGDNAGSEVVPAARPDKAGSADARDRVVRITSETLDRLMALAGEVLVDTRWLGPLGESLVRLRKDQTELARMIEQLRDGLQRPGGTEIALGQLEQTERRIQQSRHSFAEHADEFEAFARRTVRLSNRLYHQVIESRMRPFADGVRGFPRTVRDIARRLGKKVRLEIIGEDTDVDRDILDKLEAPLGHLLNNAVDHGIESEEERQARGKSAEGTIRLEARHLSGMLSITVADDGSGVDLDRLRVEIVERKLAASDMVKRMTAGELMDFMFLPSFTTASEVTDVSGRGVGLDVVRSMVQEVGGVLRANTEPGAGTTFHLQLPLTLSVVRTLVVEIAGEVYGLPMSRIGRVLRVPADDIQVVEGRQYLSFEDDRIGLVPAHQVLAMEEPSSQEDEMSIVVISDALNRYGVVVDRFVGEQDAVIRPLDPSLGKVADISSAAFLGDGSLILMIDVDDLVRSIDALITGNRVRGVRAVGTSAGRTQKRILVVDDSITVREVERQLLENRGYEVEVAVDGVDGLNAIRSDTFDLLISDVDMPRMTGFELVERVKQDPQLQIDADNDCFLQGPRGRSHARARGRSRLLSDQERFPRRRSR